MSYSWGPATWTRPILPHPPAPGGCPLAGNGQVAEPYLNGLS